MLASWLVNLGTGPGVGRRNHYCSRHRAGPLPGRNRQLQRRCGSQVVSWCTANGLFQESSIVGAFPSHAVWSLTVQVGLGGSGQLGPANDSRLEV